MKKIIIGFVFLAFSFQSMAVSISGNFGLSHNDLKIEQVNSIIKEVQGTFLNRDYDYTLKDDNNSITIIGILDGKEREVTITKIDSVTVIDDKNNTLNLIIEDRDLGTFVSGKYNDYSTSLRVDRTPNKNTVTGFYNGHLNDLRIFKTDNGLKFHGYVNGYWTDLELVREKLNLNLIGKVMNTQVHYALSQEFNNVSDLIELIVFGFDVPNVDVFKF